MNFIPISQPTITEKEINYVTDSVKSGWVSSLGKYIDIFEKNFAEYCNTKYAVSTSNGTAALHLTLAALGVSKNDEVIIPNLTFIATANAVSYTGAKVVTVDIDENTLCISPKAIEKAISPVTKAVIPVHLYGHPANMEEINSIAKKNNLFVVEDAAEAHGAEINGVKVGGLSDAAIFSFYGNKVITSGEGGIITTNNYEIYKKLKFLRDHAMSKDKRYWHTEVGFNYRMTNLQASLGLAQFERINEILAKKKKIFLWYKNELKGISQIKLNYQEQSYTNVYWLICIQIQGYSELKRDNLMTKLKSKGIDSRPFFYPISDMEMYDDNFTENAHRIHKQGFNLPSYFDLSKKQVEFICQELISLL